MSVSKYFGFKKVESGHMVYGKDLNAVIDDLDDKLNQALGGMSEAGAAAAAGVGSATYTQIVLDNEQEIIFATPINLTKARILVTNAAALGTDTADLALALASAPTVPITTVAVAIAAGSDTVVTPVAGLDAIPANEEIILIEKDTLDVGFGPSAIDVQIVVEGNKVTT